MLAVLFYKCLFLLTVAHSLITCKVPYILYTLLIPDAFYLNPSTVLLSFAYTYYTHTVTDLKVINTTTNSITITWDQPPHNYRVFLHGEATDNIPQSRVIQLVNVTGQTTHIVEGLNPFQKYSIGVFLASNNGNGSDATVIVRTTGRG